MKLSVLYEDNHILCVVKPPMIPVQADSSGDRDLLTICKEYVKEKFDKPGAVYLGLVHRLDRPVGGVMVFARTSKAAARLQKSMQNGEWHKEYFAVVQGISPDSGELCDWLLKNESKRMSFVVAKNTPGSKKALLRFFSIAQRDDLSLLAVRLESGRHHQIRVQLSHAGYPIWGDARYNSKSLPKEAIALWAHALAFPHPTKGELVELFAFPSTNPIWSRFFDKEHRPCDKFFCN